MFYLALILWPGSDINQWRIIDKVVNPMSIETASLVQHFVLFILQSAYYVPGTGLKSW